MSTVSSISSTTNTYQNSADRVRALSQDFEAISSALQSGNLLSAQAALTSFQQALQQSQQVSATQPFGKNTQANSDFNAMATDLQSGDITGAQKAFSSLQKDLKESQAGTGTHSLHQLFSMISSATGISAAKPGAGLDTVA